jgi:hypothetical protein
MPLRRAALLIVAMVIVGAWGVRHGQWPVLPQPAIPRLEKLVELLRALAALAVVNLAAVGASTPVARYLSTGGRLRQSVLRVAAGFALLGTALAVVGVAGFFHPPVVLGVVVVAALAGLPSLRDALQGLSRQAPPRDTARLLAGVLALMALPALHAFVPRYGWDALTYHLALPEWFLRTGRVGLDRASVYTSFPLLTEMLYAAGLALHGPAIAKLLHLECGALALLLVADLARAHAPRAWPLAVLAVAADPTFLWETTVAYSDLSLLLFGTATLEALLAARADPGRSPLLRAALFTGACAATRYPGLLLPAALGAAWMLRPEIPLSRRRGLALALAAGVALLLLPWFARNALATGNPIAAGAFHPLFLRQMLRFNHDIGMGHGPLALLMAPVNVTLIALPNHYSGGFGYVVGPLHLVGALALAIAPASPVRRALGIAAALYLLGWFLSVQEARYLLPLGPVLALGAATAVDDLLRDATPRARLASWGVALVALALTWSVFSPSLGPVLRVALGSIAPSRVERLEPAERLGDALRQGLPRGARVLSLFESRAWHLRGIDTVFFHVNQGAPSWAELHDARVQGRLCAWLRGRGVTHVLVNTTMYQRTPPTAVDGYGDADIVADMRETLRLMRRAATVAFREEGMTVFALDRERCVDGLSDPAAAPGR